MDRSGWRSDRRCCSVLCACCSGSGCPGASGLLAFDAPAGETVGVGLASGLMVLAAWWAAIWSGGRSSFTPVAVGFAIAIVLAVVRRPPPAVDADSAAAEGDRRWPEPHRGPGGPATDRWSSRHWRAAYSSSQSRSSTVRRWHRARATACSQSNSSTKRSTRSSAAIWLPPAPRRTSRRPDSPRIPGAPVQVWYHWGEMWLAAGHDHAPRDAGARRSLLHRPSDRVASCGRPLRNASPAICTDGLSLGVRVRFSRLPVPCARPAAQWPVLQLVGRRHDLRDHALRARCRRGPACPLQPVGAREPPSELAACRLRRQRRRLHPARAHRDRRTRARWRGRCLVDPYREISDRDPTPADRVTHLGTDPCRWRASPSLPLWCGGC